MDRLTTNNPKGNLKTAYNLFYIKGKETWVVGGGPEPDYKDISLYDFIRKIIKDYGLNIGTEKNDDMGENLYERLSDGSDTAEGIVALLYTAAWAFSEIREKLKAYEDTGLEPEEIPHLQAQLKAALEDLHYIHCAGEKGCEICANKSECKEFNSHIGSCTSFEWRGPQPPEGEKPC